MSVFTGSGRTRDEGRDLLAPDAPQPSDNEFTAEAVGSDDESTKSESSVPKLIAFGIVALALALLVAWLVAQFGWMAAAATAVVMVIALLAALRKRRTKTIDPDLSEAVVAKPDETVKQSKPGMLKRWQLKRQTWWNDRPAFVLDGKPKPGPRLVLWYFWVRLRLYKLSFIPQPRTWGVWANRNIELQLAINKLRDDIRGIVVVFITKGGAMKTTITTWVAAALKNATHKEIFGFDADTGGGKLARRYTFGDRKVIDVVKLIKKLQSGPISNRELLEQGSTDEHSGVIVSYCPPLEKDDEGNHIPGPNVSQTSTALTNLLEAVNVIFVDGGPGLSNSMIDGAFRVGDVFIQPAKYGVGEHYEDIHKVINTYRLESKLDDIILVFGAVPWLSFNTRSIHELAQEFGVTPQQVVLLPKNKYMEKLSKTNLKRIPPKVLWSIYMTAMCVAQRLAAADIHAQQAEQTSDNPSAVPNYQEASDSKSVGLAIAASSPERAVTTAPTDIQEAVS